MVAVLDTSTWLLSVPLLPEAGTIDFTGGGLSATFRPRAGGDPIVETSNTDAFNTIAFVAATSLSSAYFLIDLPNDRRTPFVISEPVIVFADVQWHPDPTRPLYQQWVGRLSLLVAPASDSPGIANASTVPVLTPIQPYDGRITTGAMIVGLQGAPAYPAFDPVADEGKRLTIVSGVPRWV